MRFSIPVLVSLVIGVSACDDDATGPHPRPTGSFSLEVAGARTASLEGPAVFGVLAGAFWELSMQDETTPVNRLSLTLSDEPSPGVILIDSMPLGAFTSTLQLDGAFFFARSGTLSVSVATDSVTVGGFNLTVVGGDTLFVSSDTASVTGTFQARSRE
ncbi:MAG: hypothetical protein ABFS34_15915 [Gemmatimonadota bacterium]